MAMKLTAALLLTAVSSPLIAQTRPAARPWPVQTAHVVKWPLLGATAAMLARGSLLSRDADRWHDSIGAACATVDPCPRSVTGRYLFPPAQAAYESYLSANSGARNWIIGGELALVATGAMFLVDLIHRDDGPRNIPFTPFSVYATPRRVGFTVRF
ncbi:MAG: hypothetical protein EXR93_10910 [Gemmatimonadetes bacterium]|nr:hypothetical protein [Gemmatimonadota bacterium]